MKNLDALITPHIKKELVRFVYLKLYSLNRTCIAFMRANAASEKSVFFEESLIHNGAG
jgi:prolipoprotein diacylglyceryltransferase